MREIGELLAQFSRFHFQLHSKFNKYYCCLWDWNQISMPRECSGKSSSFLLISRLSRELHNCLFSHAIRVNYSWKGSSVYRSRWCRPRRIEFHIASRASAAPFLLIISRDFSFEFRNVVILLLLPSLFSFFNFVPVSCAHFLHFVSYTKNVKLLR